MPQKQNKISGLWIPHWILSNNSLTYFEKFVLSYLAMCNAICINGHKSKTYCYATDKHISEVISDGGISAASINKCVRNLVRKNYIVSETYYPKTLCTWGPHRRMWINQDAFEEYNKENEPQEDQDLDEDGDYGITENNSMTPSNFYTKEMPETDSNQLDDEDDFEEPPKKSSERLIVETTFAEMAKMSDLKNSGTGGNKSSKRNMPTVEDIINASPEQQAELVKQRRQEIQDAKKKKVQSRAIRRTELIADFLQKNGLPIDSETGKKMRHIISQDKRNTNLSEASLKSQLDLLQKLVDEEGINAVIKIINQHHMSGYQSLIYENELKSYVKPVEVEPPKVDTHQTETSKKRSTRSDLATVEILKLIKHMSGYLTKGLTPDDMPEEFFKKMAYDIYGKCTWDSEWSEGLPDEVYDRHTEAATSPDGGRIPLDLLYKEIVH